MGEEQQPVAERFGTVVDGEGAGPVAARGVVHQGEVRVVLVLEDLVVVAELVVQECALAERAGWHPGGRHTGGVHPHRLDDGLPPGSQRLVWRAGVPVGRAWGFDHERAEQPMGDRGAVAGSGVHVVAALESGVDGDGEPVGRGLSLADGRGRVGTQSVSGGGDIELQPVDVQAEVAAASGVGKSDLDAVALVRADHQRLDRVVAQADGHVLGALLGSDVGDLVGQGVHLAQRVVVAETVDRDVDVKGGDVKGPVGHARAETVCSGDRRHPHGRRGCQCQCADCGGDPQPQRQRDPYARSGRRTHVARWQCSQPKQDPPDRQEDDQEAQRIADHRDDRQPGRGLVEQDQAQLVAGRHHRRGNGGAQEPCHGCRAFDVCAVVTQHPQGDRDRDQDRRKGEAGDRDHAAEEHRPFSGLAFAGCLQPGQPAGSGEPQQDCHDEIADHPWGEGGGASIGGHGDRFPFRGCEVLG